jgi:hypothetical protein
VPAFLFAYLCGGTADCCCQTLFVSEETVDGADSGLEFATRSSYVPSVISMASDAGIPARRGVVLRGPRAINSSKKNCPENRKWMRF